MNSLSNIYMLETSNYIQTLSDKYIIESYMCESFKDVFNNLINKIKKMFTKVKEFFMKLFGKNTKNDDKIENIEKAIKEIEKEEKKQKQFAINNNKQAYSKMSGKEYPKEVNKKEVKFVVNKTPIGLPEKSKDKEQLLLKYQNQLEKINAEIKYNNDCISQINRKIYNLYNIISHDKKTDIKNISGGRDIKNNRIIPYPKTGKFAEMRKKLFMKELYKSDVFSHNMSKSEYIALISPYYDRYLNALDTDPDTGEFIETEESKNYQMNFSINLKLISMIIE